MERFSQRESVLLGYSLQRSSLMNSGSSTKTSPLRTSDVDFQDVFGGPPRRFSMQEVRHGFNDVNDSDVSKGDDEQLSGLGEKPVFGDVGLNRRPYQSADFFDDIFGGDVSVNSTPKRLGRDYVFPSSPSRVLSPLPPKAEPFGNSSLLSQFSLPAKVNKGVELPTFGSAARSPYKHKDSSPNGLCHSYSSGTSLSRFSSEATQGTEASKNDNISSHKLSALFQELPHTTSEGSSNLTESNKTGTGGNLKKDLENSENSTKREFHFSIYKWASKGVPLDVPIRGKSSSRRSKELAKPEPFSGNSECVNKEESMASQPSKTALPDSSSNGHTFQTDNKLPNKLENDLPLEEAKANKVKPSQLSVPKSQKLSSLLFDVDLEQGSVEAAKMDGQKEGMVKSTEDSSSVIGVAKTTKKQERKNISVTSSEVDKISVLQCSPRNPRESNGRSRVKGRVREFVKMFNQEASPKKEALPKPNDRLNFRSQSCKWNEKRVFEEEASINTTKTDVKFQVNEDLKQSTKVDDSGQVNQAPKNTGPFPDVSKAAVKVTDESFHETFQIKVLPQDENEQLGAGAQNQEIQEIDAKIRQWTKGKEGNIRSLLSNLQYVLWAESGWKPVPLVDIIEGNAVKRAYQKALLCLHPDKLQQKGAASQQKYIAEKVFDILQEAWNYFNSLGSV